MRRKSNYLQTYSNHFKFKRMNKTQYYWIMLPVALFISLSGFSQSGHINASFSWKEMVVTAVDSQKILVPYTENTSGNQLQQVPYFMEKISLNLHEEIEMEPNGFVLFEDLDPERYSDYLQQLEISAGPIQPQIQYQTEKKQRYALIFIPVMEKEGNGSVRKVIHATYKWKVVPAKKTAQLNKRGVNWKLQSQLKDGDWIKVNLLESGMYRLTIPQIEGYGLSVAGQDVSKIRMYGYGGGMLPEDNALTVYDDLEEMAIEVRDKNSNGILDGDDDVIFFAYGPHQLKHLDSSNYFVQINYYSNQSAVFMTVGNPGGKRIQSQNSAGNAPSYTTQTFDEIIHQEEERVNIIKSGKEWFGFEFGRVNFEHTLTFNLIDQATSEPVILNTNAIARSNTFSNLRAFVNNQQVHQHNFGTVDIMRYEAQYATFPGIQSSTFNASGTVSLRLLYSRPNDASRAWLNFAEIIYRRNLSHNGQILFRDHKSIGQSFTRYNMGNTGNVVWEVSNPHEVKRINLQQESGSEYFVANSSSGLIEYAAVRNESYKTVHSGGRVANQNIHGERNVEYVIVSHPDFKEEAERLASFHQTQNGLKALVVTPDQVYNEFSSGTQDISAIRNMMRYFYENALPGSEPKYLLLFGDASYDYKNILPNNTNFVPTFESLNSVSPVGSYCSDDFFGLLDEDEGGIVDTQGLLDIGIGRFPVQTATKAKNMVDKIIRYHSPEGLGDWRNTVVMLSDDEDGNIHLHDAMLFSNVIEANHQEYNVRKIMADAYKQVTVGNGQRYPDVIKEIDRAFNDGALIVNYSGHGGEVQLGAEKFVDIPQINSWKGGAKLPLFITATCEFTRFDDPVRQSAGELVMLNPQGGGIGLLTTVRLVYSWPNRNLNHAFYNQNVFDYSTNEFPALGDILRKTKNSIKIDVNNRSFVLIGDPAMHLAYPKYNVQTTAINQTPIGSHTDTLMALSKVVIEGEIQDYNNQLFQNFNGTIYTTVFASKQKVTTLQNDPGSPEYTFEAYNSIVYKGKASVQNGLFQVEFVLPRDLPFEIGDAKISFYAENGTDDANGYEFFKMSPEIDPNATPDFAPPQIRLFMNDTNFVRGGITNENPDIFALVFDESGINTTGLGIGRDITAVLDENTQNAIILNQYYDADLDNYQSGSIRYPLNALSPGLHTLRVKVWDIHNNSAQASTEFLVAPSISFAIQNLMNYPNPFHSSTTFSFEHNKTGEDLDIEIRIYDLNGKLVKTINEKVQHAGSKVNTIDWDPYQGGVSLVGPGTYLFKLIVKDQYGNQAEGSSRIVYLPNP